MACLSIRILGGFQAHLDEVPVAGFRSDKARALLAYLATESDRPHARDSLAWLLWPDCPNELGRTNLRSALSNLHKIIDEPPGFPPHLIIERETVRFNLFGDYWSDVAVLLSLSSGMLVGIDRMERLENAARLYHGDFLQGIAVRDSSVFEDWAGLK